MPENAYSGGQFRTRSCKMRLKQYKHGKLQRRMKKRRSDEGRRRRERETGNGKRDHRQPARLGDNCILMIRHKLSLRGQCSTYASSGCRVRLRGAVDRWVDQRAPGPEPVKEQERQRERVQRNNH